jgi:hypothetical protein
MKLTFILIMLLSTTSYAQVLSTRVDDERLEDRRRAYEQVLWEREYLTFKTKVDAVTKRETAKHSKNITVNINGE